MAKTATKSAKQTTKAVAKSTGIDELSALALANKEMEDELRAQTGSQNSFITLIKTNSGFIDKNNPNFIKGLKPLDYAITSKKLILGKSLDVTITGMFKIYAEVTPKEKDSDMAKIVKFWLPDDAMQYPVEGIFDRPLPNGNTLQPHHWVFVYLHDYPEIEDGLISFRSKGNSIYAQLEKLIKAESSVCTELRFTVTHQDIYNEKQKKTDYYPKFEISGRNYSLVDGRVVVAKGADKAEVQEILARSGKVHKEYREAKMVARQSNIRALPAAGRAALPAGKGGYVDDDEDQVVNF